MSVYRTIGPLVTICASECMLEPLHGGGSNEYPQSVFWIKNIKIGKPLNTQDSFYSSVV